MRVHLAIAAVVLAGLVAAGVLLLGPSSAKPTDPVDVRDSLVAGPVVVSFKPYGMNQPSMTFTIIPGVGWMWHSNPVTAVPGVAAAQPAENVVSDGQRALTMVAPGCYTTAPAATLPPIPGVTLVRDLATQTSVQRVGGGQSYMYHLWESYVAYTVTENLSGITAAHRFSAMVSSNASNGLNGLFTVREATSADRAALVDAIRGARPSPATTLSVEQGMVRSSGPSTAVSPLTLTVLKNCDSFPVSSVDAFPFVQTHYGLPLEIRKDSVWASGYIPVTNLSAPQQEVVAALKQATPTTVRVEPGATFASPLLVPEGEGPNSAQYSITFKLLSCAATAWFPCG